MRKLIELGASIDAAICAADEYDGGYNFERGRKIMDALMALPTVDAVEVVRCGKCKDCARNADNGGVYDDGRTRCPIQEHYVLLSDGYCHLWEERKDGDA